MSEQQYPEPTVGALIFNPEGKLFLMKSPKWKDKYVIPGGHIELGETKEQALIREIKEETGLTIHDIKFLSFGEFIFEKSYYKKKHFIFFNFICKTNSSKVILNSEGNEYKWLTIQEALKLPLVSYTKDAIKDYIQN